MHIVVTLKQVYDPNVPQPLLRIGATGKSLEPIAGVTPVLNGYDANALEQAIRLKEKAGATVTAVSVGDERVKTHLRARVGHALECDGVGRAFPHPPDG